MEADISGPSSAEWFQQVLLVCSLPGTPRGWVALLRVWPWQADARGVSAKTHLFDTRKLQITRCEVCSSKTLIPCAGLVR